MQTMGDRVVLEPDWSVREVVAHGAREAPVVLITGCSTGIGRAAAGALVAAWYRVVATARDPATLDGLRAALTWRLDVTDEASIRSAVDATLERFGRIDVLVNNAGFAMRGAGEEVDVTAVSRMFDTNVLGIIRMVQAVAPVMRRQRAGRIVNVGSLAGKLGGPANGTYAASKHAVEALNDAMRWELAPFGIQVILVRPGAIATAFEQRVEEESGALLGRRDSPYAPLYARVHAANAAIRATQPGADAVANVIVAAIQAEHPRPWYPAAIPWVAQLAMALPGPAKDLVVRRLYALDGRTRAEPPSVPTPRGLSHHGAAPATRPQEIAEGVYRVSVYGANVYFVRSGAVWVLVDTPWAWGGCARIIQRAAATLFGTESRAAAILLTHLHSDHDGAALELARAWGCPIYVHANQLPLAWAVATSDLAGIERFGNGLDRRIIVPLMRALPNHWRGSRARPSLADVAKPLEAARVPGLPDWTWALTAGHPPGHVVFFRAADRVLLSGDAVLTVDASSLGGCVGWALGTGQPHACEPPGYTNWDQAATVTSVAIVAALEPRVLASGHGAPLVGDAAVREVRVLAQRAAARHRAPAVAA